MKSPTLRQTQRFLESAARWETESEDPTLRGTLWHGMIAKSCGRLEKLIRGATLTVRTLAETWPLADPSGTTLGDCLSELERLNVPISRGARARFPDADLGRRLLPRDELAALGELLWVRNRIAHGEVEEGEYPLFSSRLFEIWR